MQPSSCKFLALLLPTLASSTLLLADFPVGNNTVKIGTSHELVWLQDYNYSLDLSLVKKSNQAGTAWRISKQLFRNVTNAPCNGTYTWNITDDIELGENYALYISGNELPLPEPNAAGIVLGRGYADLTQYFNIVAAESV